jgi:hypothetical protein
MELQNEETPLSKQMVGNIGLYYVCYELSKRGWNCLPTCRNAKGIDIVIYNHNAKCMRTIQVKSLSKINDNVSISTFMADFLIICGNARANPEIFILTEDEFMKQKPYEMKDKDSYFLPYSKYKDFKDCWDKIYDDSCQVIQGT